ncbi:MAG: hypothetical protein ACWGNP_02275, partial [Candidatus Bathyarchaeia archaeon]
GITILIKIQTDQQNEKETTEPQTPTDLPAKLTETEASNSSITENSLDLQTSTSTPKETTNKPHEKDATKCIHYFGYVSSGVKIPEECLTCSKLLKCLTSKDGIEEY